MVIEQATVTRVGHLNLRGVPWEVFDSQVDLDQEDRSHACDQSNAYDVRRCTREFLL